MCVEKKRLEGLWETADDLYRRTVSALDQQIDPGSVRRAIRVANQAWSARGDASMAIEQHVAEHGCGDRKLARRPR